MIRIAGNVKDPEAIELELTITMTIGEWEAVARALRHDDQPYWPCGKFAEMVRRVVNGLERNVTEIAKQESDG